MHKLVVLIRRSTQPESLERHWSEEFVQLAERMPGLRRVEVFGSPHVRWLRASGSGGDFRVEPAGLP